MFFGPMRMPFRRKSELSALTDELRQLKGKIETMATSLENLTAAVTAQTTIEASAITLITSLADEVKALPNQDAATQALADKMTASSNALAAAIAANTPVAPAASDTSAPAADAAASTAAPTTDTTASTAQ